MSALSRALVAAGEILVAQRELQPALGVEAGLLQRALELRRVAAQQVERFGALDDQPRGDLAVVIDVEPHVDAAELGRIEADLEALQAVLRARHDLDREAGDRHRIVGAASTRSACGSVGSGQRRRQREAERHDRRVGRRPLRRRCRLRLRQHRRAHRPARLRGAAGSADCARG